MKSLVAGSRQKARGSVLGLALAGCALVAAGGALFFSHMTSMSHESSGSRVKLTANGARAWIVRAGLDPRSLVAAGFTAQDTTVIIEHSIEFLTENIQQMSEAELQLADARKVLPALERDATAGNPSQGAIEAFAEGRSLVNSLEAQVHDFEVAVFAAGTTELDPAKVARLAAMKASRSSGLPLEFRLQSRSDEDTVALRDALSAREIAIRSESQVPTGAAEVIALASTIECNEAAGRLSNCTAVTSAWNAVVAEVDGQ